MELPGSGATIDGKVFCEQTTEIREQDDIAPSKRAGMVLQGHAWCSMADRGWDAQRGG